MRSRRPLIRPGATVRAELDVAALRLDELRRDPEFLLPGSPCSTEHARVSRALAVLRAELAGSGGHRGQVEGSGRY